MTLPETPSAPRVTAIVPCRNERDYIESCLESIASQDYPTEKLEVLMMDGMSDDGTREVIARFVSTHPNIHLVDNPQRITPAAFNRGIKKAGGAHLLFLGAHNLYPLDYISQCVKALEQTGADNVGGSIVPIPRERTFFSKAILCVISHPFGVGNSKFRIHSDVPIEVDTVFGGCYHREVFDRIGLFNERLVRSQDMEFNLRLKKAGGRIFLIPSICCRYYARTDLLKFCQHNWSNGKWAILPFKFSDIIPVSLRHVVPLLFVTSLSSAVVLSLVNVFWVWGIVAILTPYLLFCGYHSIKLAIAKKELYYVWTMPVAFAALHFFYGFGSMWGLTQVVGSKIFLASPSEENPWHGQGGALWKK